MKRCFIDFEMNTDSDNSSMRTEHSIIEIGAVVCDEEGKVIDKFQTYVKPVTGNKIYSRITDLTGITNEDMKDAPNFAAALVKFSAFLRKYLLADKYVYGKYDKFALRWCINQVGEWYSYRDLHNALYDASEKIMKDWECTRTPSLDSLCDFLGVENAKEHSALCDAEALSAVFYKYKNATKEDVLKFKQYADIAFAYNSIKNGVNILEDNNVSVDEIVAAIKDKKELPKYHEWIAK